MAKPGPKPKQLGQGAGDQAATAPPAGLGEKGESLSRYFRRVFTQHPQLLEGRSNEELLNRWLADHPGETEIPERVKNILANVKSVLRKQLRGEPGVRPTADKTARPTPRKVAVKGLAALEEQIDGCRSLAKHLDREGLAGVVSLLRQARNQVVWLLGE